MNTYTSIRLKLDYPIIYELINNNVLNILDPIHNEIFKNNF